MRLSYFAAVLLPLTALASPFNLEVRADAGAKVLSDLKTVTADSNKVKAALDKFGDNDKPSVSQALAVNSAGNKLKKDIDAATSDAKGSSTFSKPHSASIYNYIKKTTQPNTISLLQDFINHAPGFAKAGFTSTVKSALQDQRSSVSALSDALTAKAVQPYKGMAPAVTKTILAKFDDAIAAYS